MAMAAIMPPQAAMLVLTITLDISIAEAASPRASTEPPLKPYQPIQRMKVPSVANGMLEPGIGLMRPFLPYLPLRAPRMTAPVNAAQPPTE